MRQVRKRQGDMRSLQHVLTTFVLIALAGCSASEPPFKGDSWTVVNYWAVWCKPCREEIPELNELNRSADVQVFGVNFDRKTGEALAVDSKTLGLEFTNIDDPSQSLGLERPSVLPTTLVINPEGGVAAVLVGPQTAATILAVIKPGLALTAVDETPLNET